MMPPARKILVIKLGALGDFIQALGPMAAIRKHHPDAEITLLTANPFGELAKASGYFDDIWIDEKPRWSNFKAWMNLKKRLNDRAFARIYDLQNNDRTALYFKMFHPRPEWVGAVKGASHRNASPQRTAGHAFDGHVQTLALAGVTGVHIDRLEWLQGSISSFPLRKPYILLIPGSAPERKSKRWPARGYARIAQITAQLGFQPVILGGVAEKDEGLGAEILADAPGGLDLSGQTSLGQIASLAHGAAGAIGNDTGPMHLIASTGCPCLALFSKESDPVKHAPRGERVITLRSENLKELHPEKVLRSFRPREEPPRKSVSLH